MRPARVACKGSRLRSTTPPIQQTEISHCRFRSASMKEGFQSWPVFDQSDRVAQDHMLPMIGICWTGRETPLDSTLIRLGLEEAVPTSTAGHPACLVFVILSDRSLSFGTVHWPSITTPLLPWARDAAGFLLGLFFACDMGTPSGQLTQKHNANSGSTIEALPIHTRLDAKEKTRAACLWPPPFHGPTDECLGLGGTPICANATSAYQQQSGLGKSGFTRRASRKS